MEKFDLNNGRLGLSSVENIYSHTQKVYLKTRKGEEKSKTLRITMELKSELTVSPGRVLCLQITDDCDCAFFYSLYLTHDDFSILKGQQGLLVDFDHFPTQLIKLLELCRSQDVTNKFILVLDEEDAVITQMQQVSDKNCVFLKIIETNNFKNLCHLSMKVRQGSDADIKKHMSLKISNLSEKLSEQTKKHEISERNLVDALKALDMKTKELSELQLKVAEEKNYLKLETSHQISEEREKTTKVQIEWQQKLELEKSQLLMQHQKQLSELNEQINLLTFNNKNLYECRCQLETSVKEKSFQIEALEKQVFQMKQETEYLRKQSSQLDQDYHEKDKLLISLKTKLAVAEQELKDKVKFLEKQQELLKAANEQKQFLEEALNEKDLHLQRKQAAVQALSSDLMKYNDIIAKLQGDLAASKAKMKLRTDIALEQEKVLEKKVTELATQSETIKDLNEKMTKVVEELNVTKTELEEAKRKIDEKDATIKKNDNVINWLNRRLTESNTVSSVSPNLISSSRTECDSNHVAPQSKGNISSLAKGWPPWLINSVAGSNSSRSDSTGLSNSTGYLTLNANTSEVNTQSNNSKTSQPITIHSDEKTKQSEEKSGEVDLPGSTTGSENKSKGIDPRYLESYIDKDFVTNQQILKKSHGTNNNINSSSSGGNNINGNVKLNTAGKLANGSKPMSAYFPKRPVTLNQ